MAKTSRVQKVQNWWKSLARTKKRKVILALASVFVTSYFVGWYFGRDMSPKYDTEDAARMFIAANLHADVVSSDEVILSADAGLATYTYTLSTDSVMFSLPPADQVAQMKPPRRNPFREESRFLALAGIAAAPGGAIGAFSTVTEVVTRATLPARITLYVTAAALCATGGALGFWMGYRDDAAYDAPVFAHALKDRDNWRAYAKPLHDCMNTRDAIALLRKIDAADNPGKPSKDADRLEASSGRCNHLVTWATRRP